MAVGDYKNRFMAPVGSIRYNGFEFPAALNAKIVGAPEYAPADVSVKHVK